ncbi:universal stress protein [Pseudoxanthomonas dokdonensis]|uniref:UspA domain-containing protein n=1 Tax=Pseudoxanthomonas dokdonensis TaxID=344882 RepID=A0A0R0CF60_9GAMM|nr:universal stress protein [Pseudoxanthomonas dokdonensis]KRG68425.1 hypothetical protein ABB29_13020 [Pseudoxanthomonas dokdonensis]
MNTIIETEAPVDGPAASRRIVAAVDVSDYAASVAQYAGWAAQRVQAGLSLLHVVQPASTAHLADLSGNLALGVHEELLDKLVRLDEQRAELVQQQGQQTLSQLQQQLQSKGVQDCQIHQRNGLLVDVLLQHQDRIRLLVIGKRGEHADFAQGHLGSNLERVVRALERPVLVASRQWKPVNRFLVAFDGSPASRKAVEMICASPLLKNLECQLLMVGDTRRSHKEAMNWASAMLKQAGFEPLLLLKSGEPESLIAEQVQSQEIDLLVMGAYGHSRIRSLLLGSTTTSLLRSCAVPVLLLR